MTAEQKKKALGEVEIEIYAKEGKEKPKAEKYIIRINKTKYTVSESSITGRELLELAGKDIDKFKVYKHIHQGQPVPIGLDESVSLIEKGVERFTTMPKDATEG